VVPYLTPACAGLLEPRESQFGLQKSTFNAEKFILRLSWSISSHFGAIHSGWMDTSTMAKTRAHCAVARNNIAKLSNRNGLYEWKNSKF